MKSYLSKLARVAGACLLLVCRASAQDTSALAQTGSNPILGAWSGQMHYGTASMQVGVRFVPDKKATMVMSFDVPEMKLRNVGPFPVEQQNDVYKAYLFAFRLAPDGKRLNGLWSFDGHDLTIELEPGALLAQPASQAAEGRVVGPVWSFKTGDAIWSSPATDEKMVYFGSDDGSIYALRAASGKQVWQFKTGARVRGSPTLTGRYLYELSDDGYLYKLEKKTGTLVWKFDTHGGSAARDLDSYDFMTSAATEADGTVYIGSADKNLYAIDARGGKEKWHFETKGVVRSKPSVSAGRVFFGGWDHNVYAVDVKAGTLDWKYDTLREVVSSPLVVNDAVYIGSRSSDLFALDAATGKIKWKYFYWSSWVESSARIRDGVLYVGSSDYQQLFAIDSATGKPVWKFDTDGAPWSTPAVTDKLVYIGAVGILHYYLIDHHGGFFAVDRSTGKVVWRYPFSSLPGSTMYGVASSPAVNHGLILFGALDGNFYAFRADG